MSGAFSEIVSGAFSAGFVLRSPVEFTAENAEKAEATRNVLDHECLVLKFKIFFDFTVGFFARENARVATAFSVFSAVNPSVVCAT